MVYDTSNPLDNANFLLRAKKLARERENSRTDREKAKKKFTTE